MAATIGQTIVRGYESGMADMGSIRGLVRTVARYFRPEYSDLDIDPYESQVALPNTSAGINAQLKFVSGIYSNTISMGRGTLESSDPRMRDKQNVKRFYGKVGEKANDIVKTIFNRPYRECLEDMALTSVLVFFVHYDEVTAEHMIIPYNPSDCCWWEDNKGNLDKVMRGFEMTVDQAAQEFGLENLPEQMQKDYLDESKCNEKHRFIHCVRRRKKRNPNRKDVRNMPYESIYVHVDTQKKVKVSGYNRMRYVVKVINKRRGLRTGYSPAMHSLPSMRTLVRGVDLFFDAVEYKAKPVMFMNDRESVEEARNMRPGDVRYARLAEQPFIYGTEGDPANVYEMMQYLIEEIRELHFLDLFNALEEFKAGQKTAYEVAQIIAEKIHLIAPIIHTVKEVFADLFDITAEDIMQYGLLDSSKPAAEQIPEELEGDSFRVRYTSRIDARVSGIETENILYAITEMMQAEQIVQTTETQAILKIEEILRQIAEKRNLDPDLTRTSQEYKAERTRIMEERQAAMMAQANAEAAAKRDLQAAPEPGSEADVVDRAAAQVA